MKLLSVLGTLTTGAVVTAFAVDLFAGSSPATGPVTGRVVFVGDSPNPASGKVVFDGDPPEIKPLSITEKQAEGCCPAGVEMDTTDPSLLIGKGNGIQNVVVTIEVKGAETKPMDKPVEIDQKMCHFEPHIRVMTIGSTVEFLNSDQVSHNVHTYPAKNDPLNKTIAPGGRESQVLEKTDKVKIACDIHPWMSGYLFVTDTPYHAVTGADGSFKISGLPPGKYQAEFWHEKLGKAKGEVVIADDGTSEPIQVEMGEEKKGKKRRR